MANARIGEQLMITVGNRVGALADVSRILAEVGINLTALCGYVIDNQGFIVFVASDNAKAKSLLKAKKFDIREEEVVLVTLDNRPGTLRAITEKIADAGIDITLLYGTADEKGKTSKVVIVSENNGAVLTAITGSK